MTTNDQRTTSQNIELVPPSFACPKCGQRDINQIITEDDGETTTCHSCNTHYIVTQHDQDF